MRHNAPERSPRFPRVRRSRLASYSERESSSSTQIGRRRWPVSSAPTLGSPFAATAGEVLVDSDLRVEVHPLTAEDPAERGALHHLQNLGV